PALVATALDAEPSLGTAWRDTSRHRDAAVLANIEPEGRIHGVESDRVPSTASERGPGESGTNGPRNVDSVVQVAHEAYDARDGRVSGPTRPRAGRHGSLLLRPAGYGGRDAGDPRQHVPRRPPVALPDGGRQAGARPAD